jgi:hypothetical protein
MLKKPLFSLNKKPQDVYALSVFLILTSLIIAFTHLYNAPSGDLFVSVYMDTVLVDQHSLYVDQTIRYLPEDYDHLLGPLSLEIKNESMRIVEETSPLNICSEQGSVRSPGLPLICAPNAFLAVIEGFIA